MKSRTVTIPAITNTYVSADNVSYTDTGISDQVNLTGLTRGNTYTLVGKIIDKSNWKGCFKIQENVLMEKMPMTSQM